MDAALKAKWVEALRSGKYRQAKEVLKTDDGGFCCLGVLCDVMGARWEGSLARLDGIDGDQCAYLNDAALKVVGLSDTQQGELYRMNDSGGKTFPEIADHIEVAL